MLAPSWPAPECNAQEKFLSRNAEHAYNDAMDNTEAPIRTADPQLRPGHPLRHSRRLAELRQARDMLCAPIVEAVVEHLLAQGAPRAVVAAALAEMKEKR